MRVGGCFHQHLDDVPLWRGNHVPVKQLVDDFARYLYLPRLASPEVLTAAMRDGVTMLSWATETFAYAEGFDESAGRYRGMRHGQNVTIVPESSGLLVHPATARAQIESEQAATTAANTVAAGAQPAATPSVGATTSAPAVAPKRRYYGSVKLDPARVGRDASRIAEEVIAHLVAHVGAEVTVTLEIEARIPEGASDQTVRTVTENSRTLKFEPGSGFENE